MRSNVVRFSFCITCSAPLFSTAGDSINEDAYFSIWRRQRKASMAWALEEGSVFA